MTVRIRFFHILNLLKMLPRFIYCLLTHIYAPWIKPWTGLELGSAAEHSGARMRSVGQLRGMFPRKSFSYVWSRKPNGGWLSKRRIANVSCCERYLFEAAGMFLKKFQSWTSEGSPFSKINLEWRWHKKCTSSAVIVILWHLSVAILFSVAFQCIYGWLMPCNFLKSEKGKIVSWSSDCFQLVWLFEIFRKSSLPR